MVCVCMVYWCCNAVTCCNRGSTEVEAGWKVMTHAQKPDFVFSAKRTSPSKPAGASFRSTTDSRGVHIGGSNAAYTMFRGSVKGTGYPLHSPVSPSLPHPNVTVCHHISTGVCPFRAPLVEHIHCEVWQATSPVHYTTSCKHSLVLLRVGEIIARNMLSWL